MPVHKQIERREGQRLVFRALCDFEKLGPLDISWKSVTCKKCIHLRPSSSFARTQPAGELTKEEK